MQINTEQLQQGIAKYFEQEIASKATGFKKFVSYFVMASYEQKLPQMINKLKESPLIIESEIISQDGLIDIDKLYNYAKTAYSHSGQFMLGGIIFNESDIDKLYRSISNV